MTEEHATEKEALLQQIGLVHSRLLRVAKKMTDLADKQDCVKRYRAYAQAVDEYNKMMQQRLLHLGAIEAEAALGSGKDEDLVG